MDDPGPLQRPDITAHLAHPEAFGVTTGRAADGVPTVEFTTDPSVHGRHGEVRARRAAPSDGRLFADVRIADRAGATCQSGDSVRVWGSFASGAELAIRSAAAVRLFARTPARRMS